MTKLVSVALWVGLGVGVTLAAGSARGESIAGVCPDGSAFVVQSKKSAPCPNARFVHPTELPPLRPEMLPKPYLWYIDQQRLDANNPYLLVERAQRMRELRAEQARAATRALNPKTPQVASGPQRGTPQALDLRFDERELGDLVKLIALRQSLAPATLEVKDARGNDQLRIRFAHSDSFEARVLEEIGADPTEQRVMAFYARASVEAEFHPNFLVVQDGRTFRPDKGDPSEVGILVGEAGPIEAGLLVLGYVVVPARFDPTRPIQIYWNDRSLTTTLRP